MSTTHAPPLPTHDVWARSVPAEPDRGQPVALSLSQRVDAALLFTRQLQGTTTFLSGAVTAALVRAVDGRSTQHDLPLLQAAGVADRPSEPLHCRPRQVKRARATASPQVARLLSELGFGPRHAPVRAPGGTTRLVELLAASR